MTTPVEAIDRTPSLPELRQQQREARERARSASAARDRLLLGAALWALAAGLILVATLVRTRTPDHTTFDGHRGSVEVIVPLDDGRIASGGYDEVVLVWDPDELDAAPVVFNEHVDPVLTMAQLGDGRIVSASWYRALLWHPDEPEEATVVAAINQPPADDAPEEGLVAVTADGLVVVFDDRGVTVIDPTGATSTITSARTIARVHDPRTIAITDDGRLIGADVNGRIVVTLPLTDGSDDQRNLVLLGHEVGVETTVLLPDGRLASGGWDDRIEIYDLATSARRGISLNGHESTVSDLAPLADDRLVSTSWDTTVRLWSTAEVDRAPAVFTGHRDSVGAVAVLADGRIASGDSGGLILVWSPDAG